MYKGKTLVELATEIERQNDARGGVVEARQSGVARNPALAGSGREAATDERKKAEV